MSNKLIALFMAAIVAVMSSVTAFATDTEVPTWLGGTGEDEIPIVSEPLEPSVSSVSSPDGDSSEQGSETPTVAVPDGSVLLATGTGELPTVNVSDESIQALADAVAAASTGDDYVLVTFSDGNQWPVHPDVLNYPYIFCYVQYNGSYIRSFGSDAPFTSSLDNPTNNWDLDNTSANTVHYWTKIAEFESGNISWSPSTFDPSYGQALSAKEGAAYWANHDIYSSNGVLVHPDSTHVPEFSFVTGFDDLSYSPIEYGEPLPVPKYDGYTFMGWYLDSEFTTIYDGSEISEDTTLYAKWDELGAMAAFWQVVFASLIELLNCEPIFYLFTLICLCMIMAVLRLFINSR